MSQKILIVDDDIDSLKLIGLMLQRNGYEVSAANAGNQAIAKALAERPDLIILDVMMPDMNGYEVCRRLRANDKTRDIPIIMFTAKTLIDDKVAGFEAGADDYLTKPTHPTELASRVRTMLQRNRSRSGGSQTEGGMAIGVIGAKGGLGTSTLVINLAAALIGMNRQPMIADFRLGQGSMGLFLGLEKSSGMGNILSRLASEITPDAITRELITHQTGIKALLSSSNPREQLLSFSVESAQAVVAAMKRMGKPSIFDLGSGLSPVVTRVHPMMDQIILVVDSSGVTLSMARDLLNELKTEKPERVHLVVINRSQISQQPPWNEVEQVLKHEIRAIIAAAPDLAYQAMEEGVPIVAYQPNAIVTSQISKLAEDVAIED
ncbi:MAG: response regulator [Anaerolineaceae bacterium]|nr:MAG: response regulator [Anaerolineaceae bacterium]